MRWIGILALITLAFALTGCAKEETTTSLHYTVPPPEPSTAAPPSTVAPPATEQPTPAGEGKIVKLPSGLEYEDLKEGTGPMPKTGNKVVVNYVGKLTNGKKFDSSYDRNEPFTFMLGMHEVIAGWDEGLSTMKVGGKRRLYIPPNLAYGEKGAGNDIPPNAKLIFEVELLAIR